MKQLYCAALIAAALPAFAAAPDYVPVFATKALQKQMPELKVNSFLQKGKSYDQPSLAVGNKRISIREVNRTFRADRDHDLRIYVDDEEIMNLQFWGSYDGKGNFGYPFKDLPDGKKELRIDKNKKTVTWFKEYQLPDGKRATFFYQLKPIGESRVELSWDLGIPPEKEKEFRKQHFGVSFWFGSQVYKNAGMKIDGLPYPGKNKTELLNPANKPETIQKKGSRLELYPDKPAKTVALEFPVYTLLIQESGKQNKITGKESFSLFVRTSPTQQTQQKERNRIIIDFGKGKVDDKSAPPPNGGIDFWKRDAMHVPLSPVRNLMPNPSFEQGLRYWTWQNGGADNKGATDTPRYSVDSAESLFGKSSLRIAPVQGGAAAMQSFPLPMEKNKTYTLSFSAKSAKPGASLTLGFFSVTDGGKFPRDYAWKKSFPLTTEWQRFSYTVTADGAGTALVLNARGSEVRVDGIQLEQSEKATEFVAPPVEGRLFTSDPDNTIESGTPVKATFELYGKPGIRAEVLFTLTNFYREVLYQGSFRSETGKRFSLPFDKWSSTNGIYILKAEYRVPGMKPYYDYYRFTVIRSLAGKHAVRTLFSTLIADFFRVPRQDDVGRLYQRSGFGGTSYPISSKVYPEEYRIQTKYGIEDFLMLPPAALPFSNKEEKEKREFLGSQLKKLTAITPEAEKKIEEITYEAVSNQPQRKYWAPLTESEGSPILRAGKFDEWFKAQAAFARGAKRANPNVKLMPCGGTSGWSQLRGLREMTGYLKASQGKIKWDAIAVHPYWDLDGTKGFYDLDTEIARLIDLMKQFGYGKETPILLTEGFNIPNVHVPEWSANLWNDPYCGNRPTYDTSLREFVQASLAARTFLICMKYWPQVQHFNIWESRLYFDMYLTPKALCLAVNTLGHLLDDPEYLADIRPANGVRGYTFRNRKDSSIVTALWCTIDKVEDGFERGPVLKIKFDSPLPELIDLMGNRRELKTEPDGTCLLQLTPAPFFLKGGDPVKIAKALNQCEVIGSDSNTAVAFAPAPDGKMKALIRNLTGREQKGVLEIDGTKRNFSVAPASEKTELLPMNAPVQFGKLFRWNKDFTVRLANGSVAEKHWNMDYFYVPYVKGTPDWSKIPAIPIRNVFYNKNAKMEQKAQVLSAEFQTAWNESGFYVRVKAKDADFVADRKKFTSPNLRNNLYILDGALEVYFDCGANGRSNVRRGYDQDDYRYDFSYGNLEGKTGPGFVNRLRAVNWQFAGGLDMPTKEQANREIKCTFTRTADGYIYDITFEPKYIEPIRLEPGFTAGFALFLHNQDQGGKYSALSMATENGTACDYNPHLWPLMILAKQQ